MVIRNKDLVYLFKLLFVRRVRIGYRYRTLQYCLQENVWLVWETNADL
jgi:hypothetical protein